MIILYDSTETEFTSNGLVVLSEIKSCPVTEELNGIFECSLEYPLDERSKWQYLLEGNILKVDGQLFRIYHKVKTLSGIKVNARHIFYDLIDNFIENLQLTSISGAGALNSVLSNTQYVHGFKNASDVGGNSTTEFVRTNPVDAIMGNEGVISIWGGELVRDNFTIKLLQARGLDRGVLIAYGKNIVGIEETLDLDGVCTRLMPVGKDGLLLSEKYVDSPYINNYPHPKIRTIEFTDVEDEETLRLMGQAYFFTDNVDIPKFNYSIDFIELSKTEEYKHYAILERVYLGDTVTIKHNKLGIDLKAKVIRIVKNALTERIEKVELGSFKPNIASGISGDISGIKKDITKVTSAYQLAIDNATQLITGSKGGNVVIKQDAAGKPIEILIMDTDDMATAENVWRWNLGGFGHSSTGVEGPFDTAITQDGSIVAAFITGLVINGAQINAGIIQSTTGKWQLNLDGETITLGDKLYFDGTNLIFGDGVTLSWDKVTNTPTILSADDITSTIITKDFIASMNLLVGNEIKMGSNATISWANVTEQPFIPETAADVGALPYDTPIPSQYTDSKALQAWVNSGYATYIDSGGVYSKTMIAQAIETLILRTATISGTLSAQDKIEVGVTNSYGTCHINTAADGIRMQSHKPGSYLKVADGGGLELYYNDTLIAHIDSTGAFSGAVSNVTVTAKFA